MNKTNTGTGAEFIIDYLYQYRGTVPGSYNKKRWDRKENDFLQIFFVKKITDIIYRRKNLPVPVTAQHFIRK
jgi:hypothetical protein